MKKFIKNNLSPKYLIHLLAWKNFFFGEPEIKFLKNIVNKEKTAIDIGANRGIYSYFLSKLAKDVIAYEPNPKMFNFLLKAKIKGVKINNIALSDSKRISFLKIPIFNDVEVDGWASLSKNFDEGLKKSYVEVNVDTLDNKSHKNVGFIKIDVEGHEEAVINGARNLIKMNKPTLLIEIEQQHIKKPIKEIFYQIIEFGYCGFFLINGNLIDIHKFDLGNNQSNDPKKSTNNKMSKYINNFIFLPKN